MTYQLDTTVKGGLPVTIEYDWSDADTSVGIMSGYCDGWSIVAIAGRKCKKHPQWVKLTDAEEDNIRIECEVHHDGLPDPCQFEPDYD